MHLERPYTEDQQGIRQHRVWRKRTKRWDVIPIKEQKVYAYIPELLKLVFKCRYEQTEAIRKKRT